MGKGMKKYLLYALGEILLVVIGILIAVSINNWNEGRKAGNAQRDLAQKVRTQMVLDTVNFNKVIAFNRTMKKRFDLVLRETKVGEPLQCTNCTGLIMGNVNIANMDPKVKHLLRDAELANDTVSKVLRRIEEAYEDSSVILKLLEDTLFTNFKDNMDHLGQFPWFAPLLATNDCDSDCQDYFANSTDFRNRVAYLELIIQKAYDTVVQRFNEEVKDFISDLENALNATE